MSLWLIGFVAGLVIVLVVALLLIGILVEAMRIRALARQEPLVYLPTHDPEAAKRLLTTQTVPAPRN